MVAELTYGIYSQFKKTLNRLFCSKYKAVVTTFVILSPHAPCVKKYCDNINSTGITQKIKGTWFVHCTPSQVLLAPLH